MATPSSHKSSNKPDEQNKGSAHDKDDNISNASRLSTEKTATKTNDDHKRIKLLTTQMSLNIIKAVEEECEKIPVGEDASKISERLYKMLEKKYPQGWCVFVGRHYYGLCVHEENHCLEFEIDDYRAGIFKIYVPTKK